MKKNPVRGSIGYYKSLKKVGSWLLEIVKTFHFVSKTLLF